MAVPNYLAGYPDEVQAQARELIVQGACSAATARRTACAPTARCTTTRWH
jgi:hypothetical protein